MSGYKKQVEITKSVPVADRETLIAWLNGALHKWLNEEPGSTTRSSTLGSAAVDLIEEAGFTIKNPTAVR